METSQQEPRAVVRKPNPAFFSIEIEAPVFKRLSTLATKEGIGINELGSALIKCLLLLHRSEVQRVVEQVRRNHHATS